MSLSPTCTVNGSAPPQSVAASATVNVALASASGVRYWSLAAIGCDDVTSLATINASIAINQTAKTATFTAPSSAGSCVILQSTVGISGLGLDANGAYQSSFSTTLKVNVPTTTHALHVVALNETFEDNPAGWIAALNAAIRQVG